jgi:hypothetical protein
VGTGVAVAVALMLAMVGGVGFFVRWLVVRGRREQNAVVRMYQQMDTTLARLGGREPGVTSRGWTWTLQHGGRRVEAHRHASRSGTRFTLALALGAQPGAGAGPFRGAAAPALRLLPRACLRRESGVDRFGKAVRLNREVQLGDARFDAAVYIESDAHGDELRALLQAANARNAALELVEMGGEVLVNDGGHELAVVWQKVPPPSFEGDQLEHALRLLGSLADALPSFGALEPRRWARGSGITAATAIGLVAGWVLVMVGHGSFQPLESGTTAAGMALGGAAWVLVALLAFVRVRATARALRYFAWTLGLGMLTFPLLGVGTIVTVNGLFDASVKTRSVEVLKRWTTSGKSTSYRALLAPWPPHEQPIEVVLDEDEYRELPEHGVTRVRLGRGALGFEWFAGLAPAR